MSLEERVAFLEARLKRLGELLAGETWEGGRCKDGIRHERDRNGYRGCDKDCVACEILNIGEAQP